MPATLTLPNTDTRLHAIRAKVESGQRLTLEDGELLYSTPDIWTVCELADQVRRRLHGDVAYYNINRHLNYSNVCALSCKFCEFYRKKDEEGAYTRDMAYVREEVAKAIEGGATEIHSVGGLHPYLPFSYYTDLIRTIRETADSHSPSLREGAGGGFSPDSADAPGRLHIKAFTAVEIVHLARIAKVYKQDDRVSGIRWVLTQLKEAGLGSLPGGGQEVFDDRIHDEAFKGKIRSDVWLDVHRTAHELGLNTNATILYGHIEEAHDRLTHMDMLRRAQDEALAHLGYKGVAPTLSPPPPAGPTLSPPPPAGEMSRGCASDRGGPSKFTGGHLGYRGPSSSSAPIITLTRPGTLLPTPTMNAKGGYYQTIIPLPFYPDGSDLEHLPGPAGLENLRTLAISRLMLDNFPHVKAFWIMQTLAMAQLMLQNGADDIDGTVVWYDITKVGGSSTHQEVTVATLQKAIREAGFKPVERDTLYRPVTRDGNRWTVEPRA